MSTHIGTIETAVELSSEHGPAIETRDGSPFLDARSRLLQQLARERAIAARTRAEGLSDD